MTIESPDSENLELQDSPQLEIQERSRDGARTLVMRGELDMACAPMLDAELRRLCTEAAKELTLDLSELTFMDSTGLRTILLAEALCRQHACKLLVVPGPPQVQRLFEVTGMLDRLPLKTETQAPKPGV